MYILIFNDGSNNISIRGHDFLLLISVMYLYWMIRGIQQNLEVKYYLREQQ